MATKVFTDESLQTFVGEIKSYTDEKVSTKANSSHNHTVANITDLTVTADELNYMDGVYSNVQTQLDEKLSTSGGNMTGAIEMEQANLAKRSVDTSSVSIYGGTGSSNGATVTAYGKENTLYPGYFALKANNGESSSTLEGSPDGTLKWKGKNIVALGTSDVIPISSGGTGASTASDALSNLGGVPKSNPTISGSFSMNKLYSSTTGLYSVVEGYNCSATGDYGAHAEGYYTEANGNRSHAEGDNSIANGIVSHAEGQETIANGDYQHVQGKYNIEDADNNYAHIVGNGNDNSSRSNAHTLDWDGNAWFAGDVYVGGASQDDAIKLEGMNPADKAKLDGINIYTQNEEPNDAPVGSIWIDMDEDYTGGSGGSGGMSEEDKAKLDSIEEGAQKNVITGISTPTAGGVTGYHRIIDADGNSYNVPQISDPIANGTIDGRLLPLAGVKTSNNTINAVKGGVYTTSTVTSTSGLTACPIISGVPYYKDTDTTYTLGSFGITATAAELNYCDGVTSNIQTQLNGKADAHSHNYLPLGGGTVTGGITANNITTTSSLTAGGSLTAKAAVEVFGATPYIDFHFANNTGDYTSRLIETASGTLHCSKNFSVGETLKVSGTSTLGRIDASNEYLTGSLYVGGKSSTSDGKTGVAFGASGNITMQGSSNPALNFISGTNTSVQACIQSDVNGWLHLKSNSSSIVQRAGTDSLFYPATDNTWYLGGSSYRWKAVYGMSSAISTSDRNQKENIQELDDKYIQMFDKLQPVTYELIGSGHDRVHIGYISQDVKEAMDEVGLTDLDFAGYCRDKKTKPLFDENGNHIGEEEILDADGNPEYIYSLRYGEFIALNTKMIQMNRAKIAEQQEEINNLKSELEALKATVSELLNK